MIFAIVTLFVFLDKTVSLAHDPSRVFVELSASAVMILTNILRQNHLLYLDRTWFKRIATIQNPILNQSQMYQCAQIGPQIIFKVQIISMTLEV